MRSGQIRQYSAGRVGRRGAAGFRTEVSRATPGACPGAAPGDQLPNIVPPKLQRYLALRPSRSRHLRAQPVPTPLPHPPAGRRDGRAGEADPTEKLLRRPVFYS